MACHTPHAFQPDKQVILYDNGLGGDNAVAYSTQYPE